MHSEGTGHNGQDSHASGWRHAPKLLLCVAALGILWGLAALASLAMGRRILSINPYFGGTPYGDATMAAMAVLSLVQARAILQRTRRGVCAVWAWCASFPLAHWFMSPSEQRARLAAVGAVFAVAVGAYAWHNRWWFATGGGLPAPPYRGVAEPAARADSRRRPEGTRRVFSVTLPRPFALFRDVLPQGCRDLPPLFYQFITAGAAFGLVALVASVTVLPIHAAHSPSSLAQASLVVAPALGVLGILQALGLLIRARWAPWSLYAWLLAIAVAAWLYLPRLSSSPIWPILVTACLALCAYYFHKRRSWFRRSR